MATSFDFEITIRAKATPLYVGGDQVRHIVAADAEAAAAAWTALADTANEIVKIRRADLVDGIDSGASDTLAGNPLGADLDAAGHRIANLSAISIGGVFIGAGTGAPVNGSLPDGSYYLRADPSGPSTSIYFASGGAWAGLV